jgi:hypothetical protein
MDYITLNMRKMTRKNVKGLMQKIGPFLIKGEIKYEKFCSNS